MSKLRIVASDSARTLASVTDHPALDIEEVGEVDV
jgi:hypothetical protein